MRTNLIKVLYIRHINRFTILHVKQRALIFLVFLLNSNNNNKTYIYCAL